ncbi:hypothetical protein [Streptomyces sp. NPDC058861]
MEGDGRPKVFLRPDGELAEKVRREAVEPLFPASGHEIGVRVRPVR